MKSHSTEIKTEGWGGNVFFHERRNKKYCAGHVEFEKMVRLLSGDSKYSFVYVWNSGQFYG